MYIIKRSTGEPYEVVIERVKEEDRKLISKKKYFFDWRTEKNVFKLRRIEEPAILGLLSLEVMSTEPRVHINLLTVSAENRGRNKEYERIAGVLIGFACSEAKRLFEEQACVSLQPKDAIREYYMKYYGMENAGKNLYLAGLPLLKILIKYA